MILIIDRSMLTRCTQSAFRCSGERTDLRICSEPVIDYLCKGSADLRSDTRRPAIGWSYCRPAVWRQPSLRAGCLLDVSHRWRRFATKPVSSPWRPAVRSGTVHQSSESSRRPPANLWHPFRMDRSHIDLSVPRTSFVVGPLMRPANCDGELARNSREC